MPNQRFKSKRLRDSAQGQECQMKLFGVCNHDQATVVLAHSNLQAHGKGMGLKVHDCFGAYLCSACHDAYDGRSKTDFDKGTLQNLFDAARDRTLLEMFRQGIIKVV